jgi:hypothetical protein
MKRPTFRDVKLFAWNAGAAYCTFLAITYNNQNNTPESIWYNVMAFGLLMLARTEPKP